MDQLYAVIIAYYPYNRGDNVIRTYCLSGYVSVSVRELDNLIVVDRF